MLDKEKRGRAGEREGEREEERDSVYPDEYLSPTQGDKSPLPLGHDVPVRAD